MDSKLLTPRWRTCMVCETAFLAEWARHLIGMIWTLSELCWPCEECLRKTASTEGAAPR